MTDDFKVVCLFLDTILFDNPTWVKRKIKEKLESGLTSEKLKKEKVERIVSAVAKKSFRVKYQVVMHSFAQITSDTSIELKLFLNQMVHL